jgi:hypothetical protein
MEYNKRSRDICFTLLFILLIYSPLAFPLARPQSLLLFSLERHVIFSFCQFIRQSPVNFSSVFHCGRAQLLCAIHIHPIARALSTQFRACALTHYNTTD